MKKTHNMGAAVTLFTFQVFAEKVYLFFLNNTTDHSNLDNNQ